MGAGTSGPTVAEMKAWRRAQRGEDLSEPSEGQVDWFPSDPWKYALPAPCGIKQPAPHRRAMAARPDAVLVASGVARAAEEDDYAPFRDGVVTPPTADTKPVERPAPSVEQLVRRMTTALERCVAAIDGPFRRRFSDVPVKDRRRLPQGGRTTGGQDSRSGVECR